MRYSFIVAAFSIRFKASLTDMLVNVLGSLSQAVETSEVALMVTVRKVEAGNAHASINELLKLRHLPASRTKCALKQEWHC